MYDAYKNAGDTDEPRFRLTALKREKPSIRDILLAAADTAGFFQADSKRIRLAGTSSAEEKTKADSIPGDTWYTK